MRWLKRKPAPAAASSSATRPTGLRTARLRLRPLREPDLEALHALWTQPGVRRYLWDDRVLSREQVRDAIGQSVELFDQHGYGLWGAFDEAGTLMGFCGYWAFRNAHDLELLYGVDDAQRLRGYAREMAEALVAYGFDTLKLDELRASTDAPNLGSQRVLRRLGFVADAPRPGGDRKLYFRLPRTRREDAGSGWEAA